MLDVECYGEKDGEGKVIPSFKLLVKIFSGNDYQSMWVSGVGKIPLFLQRWCFIVNG